MTISNDKEAVLILAPGAQCVKGGNTFKILAAGAVIASDATEDAAWKAARAIKEKVEPLARVTAVRVRKCDVVCPYCVNTVVGVSFDPRGREVACGKCGKIFVVSADANINF